MAIQVGIPLNLLTYKPQQQTTALCWQLNLDPPVTLDALDFELQVDVVDTFDSINKKVYTKDNVVNYQNGTFFKSFVLDDTVLIDNAQKYYWRVRAYNEYAWSYWSDVQKQSTEEFLAKLEYNKPTKVLNLNNNTQYITITKNHANNFILNNSGTAITEEQLLTQIQSYGIFNDIYVYVGPQEYEVAKAFWYEDTELAERLLPDRYVYTKNGNTNIKRILEMYMRLIGVFKNEMVQVQNNYNYKKTQDKDLYDMLGVLLDYTSNTQEPMVTYKYELLNLWDAYLHQGTVEAMNILFRALYGTEPKIEILKDIVDDKWVVYEQMPMLSIDGSTPSTLAINQGDAFYNRDKNKIIIATEKSDIGSWENAIEQIPNETTTYQVIPEKPDTKGLCFTALANNSTVELKIWGNAAEATALRYSTDGLNWVPFLCNQEITLSSIGDKIYVKGYYRYTGPKDDLNRISFVMHQGKVKLSGNVYSVLDEENFENILDLSSFGENILYGLFFDISGLNNPGLIDASELQLPATVLTKNCYRRMFQYCSKLERAPQLPATILAEGCYSSMFNSCDVLVQAPILPATQLETNCYTLMFYGCPLLNSIQIGYTGNFNTTYFNTWVEGVSALGDFYYNGEDVNNFGNSAIPTGWTVHTFNNLVINNNSIQEEENTTINEDIEITNYYYNGLSQEFVEGIPNVKRYYVRDSNNDIINKPNPYLYTNQYLASNIVVTVYNYYGVEVDQKILKQIVNNLKPLNVNITIVIIDDSGGYYYGLIDKYGNPVNYWGMRRRTH